MSQSRHEAADDMDEHRTRNSRALATMMRQGRSFSGREQNCCFLNTLGQANTRFANVSSSSGLGYSDDGRAVAVVDWEMDGDLDVWITNRNAPRIRLMRNNLARSDRFIAFRLEGNGTTSNRDAIGARIEIQLEEAGRTRRRVRSLRAGEAFLGQSSKWVHFGLQPAEVLRQVRVRWPDGAVQEFEGLESGQRYKLVQSASTPRPWVRETVASALTTRTQTPVSTAASARIPVSIPLRVPKMDYLTFAGERHDVRQEDRPLLINLWASWCQPCHEELRALAQRDGELRQAGLDVIALCVDGLDEDHADLTTAVRLLQDWELPFAAGRATNSTVATIQFVHDQVAHSRRPVPVPTSLLLDAAGRLLAIYKGTVSVDELLRDVDRSQMTRVERNQNAASIAGSTIDHACFDASEQRLHSVVLFQVATALDQAGRREEAIDYFRDAIAVDPQFAKAYHQLGLTLSATGDPTGAIDAYRRALEVDPNLVETHVNWGNLLQSQNDFQSAIEHYQLAIRSNPRLSAAYYNWAVSLQQLEQHEQAVEKYRAAIDVNRQFAPAYAGLGNAHLRLKQIDDAQTQLREALRLDPTQRTARVDLARALVILGRYDEAVEEYMTLVEHEPDNAAAHQNLGNALKLAGRLDAAITQYQTALSISPDLAAAHHNWGVVLQTQGNIREAISHYEQALKVDPNFVESHRRWAEALQSLGHDQQAVVHYQAALRIKPDQGPIHFRLGNMLLRLQRSDQALFHLERAATLLPTDDRVAVILGRVMLQRRRWREASEQFRRCLQLNPNSLDATNLLAWLLATCPDDQLRNGPRALELATRAAERTQYQQPSVLDTLAASHAELGQFSQAVKWQSEAVELAPARQKNDFAARLKRYRASQPFRDE